MVSPALSPKVSALIEQTRRMVTPTGVPGAAPGSGGVMLPKVGSSDAELISSQYAALTLEEKAQAIKPLKELLQKDSFELSDAARAQFKAVLGFDPRETTVKATGDRRSVTEQLMRIAKGGAKVSKEELEQLLKDVPEDLRPLLLHTLQSGIKEGELKLEPEANKARVRAHAQANQNGAVDALSKRFGESFAKRVPPYVLSSLSNPPMFEELLFVMMITLTSDTQREVLEEQKRMAHILDSDDRQSRKREEQTKALNQIVSASPKTPALDRVDPKKLSDETPQRQLEAVVEKAHDVIHGDDVDPRQILGALEKLDPEVQTLLGKAFGTAIQHSEGKADPVAREKLATIFEWAKEKTGLETFPVGTPLGESSSEIVNTLLRSDKLEEKLAGYTVGAFLENDAVASIKSGETSRAATVKAFAPVLQEIVDTHGPKMPADAEVVTRLEAIAKDFAVLKKAGADPTFEELIDGAIDGPYRNLPDAEREALRTTLNDACAALPTDREATAADVDKAFRTATNSLVDHVLDEQSSSVRLVVGEAVENALQRAAGQVEHRTEKGEAVPKDAQRTMLTHALEEEQKKLLQEAQKNGFNDDQLNALAKTFGRAAERELEKLERTGKIEPTQPRGAGSESLDPAETDHTRSRQIMFENLKFKMNMLSEMMQSMSNILNTMHQNAENTIRAIR